MATIGELNDIWQKLDIYKVIGEIIVENKDLIVDLNKEQLLDGFNADGNRLQSYRNKYYARRKFKQNPKPGEGNPDLFLTGRFFEGFKLELSGDRSFDLFSIDSKYKELTAKYPGVFGLRITKKQELQDAGFTADIQKNLKKEVKL